MTEVTNEAVSEAEELTVEVDGVKHKVSDLSAEVQDMLKTHQTWSREAATKTDAAMMARAAVQQVANQIVESVRAETTAEAAPVVGDATGTPAV